MSSSHPVQAPNGEPDSSRYPGAVIRLLGDYAWRILALGTVGYFAIHLLTRLSLVMIPFIASILMTALLRPVLNRFRRMGLGRGPSTLFTMLSAVVILGGIITVVVIRAADQAPQLGNEINSLIPHIKNWLINGPLKLNRTSVDNLSSKITKDVTNNSSRIASTAYSTGKTFLEVLGEVALAIFSTIFLLYDGDRVWGFLLKAAPPHARPSVDAAARAAWATVSHYVRGTLIVALFHGVVVAVTLAILGVPLAFPLAVLVALGSFVPLVGAVLTGTLAVGVAGLSQGLFAAIVVTSVLLLDNQVEAHVLQPFVVGRYVRIHPLAVVLALASGAILFGIVGAIIAVPVVGSVNSAVRAALSLRDQTIGVGTVPPEGG
jgi:predicted PurR-regulated permease PerM